MVYRPLIAAGLLSCCVFLGDLARADAVQPAEQLLPGSVKAYISVPDMDEAIERWNATQLGHLTKDPAMKPFVDDLQRQFHERLTATGRKLGLTWDDLKGVYSGEVATAVLYLPDDAAQKHAVVLLADVTGREAEAKELLEKIRKDMAERGATRAVRKVGEVEQVVYTKPRREGRPEEKAIYFHAHDQLVAVDHAGLADTLAARLTTPAEDTLAALPAFKLAMERCHAEAGELAPHARWFLEPFGYIEAMRAANGGRKERGTDLLRVLRNQGFDAVSGMGGLVNFDTAEHEILYRLFVCAPPEKLGAERFKLAARMLQFPNGGDLHPLAWIPENISSFTSCNWKMREAFEFSKTIVNELAGDEVFEDILRSLKEDPHGPEIDIRNDLIAHVRDHGVLITDYVEPITPQSERMLVGVRVAEPVNVADTIRKAMENDPQAVKIDYKGHVIWEITAAAEADLPEVSIGGFGFEEPEAPIEEEKPILPNHAITVAFEQLIVASHVDFIKEVIDRAAAGDTLAMADDYRAVAAALDRLGAGVQCARTFARTDQQYRTTFQLLKEGKMPESESMFGRFLNRVLGPEEEGVAREQQIDGKLMPEFEAIRRYLGPSGAFVRSDEHGWMVNGVLLERLMQ